MRMSGAIRSLSKGYGFIAGDDGENYYLHWSAMRADAKDFRQLRLRERVNFEIKPPVSPRSDSEGKVKQPTGRRAVDAYILSSSSLNEEKGEANA